MSCRFRRFWVIVRSSREWQIRKRGRRKKGVDDEVHGDGQGDERVRSRGRHAEREDPRRDGRFQRAAHESGGPAGGGGLAAEREGGAREVLRNEADGRRRSLP